MVTLWPWWAVVSPGMTPLELLGKAHPTCEKCGRRHDNRSIEILGEPDPDTPGDYTQITFRLPARHVCRAPRAGPDLDLREDRPPGADGP